MIGKRSHLVLVEDREDLADHWDGRERSEERALAEHDALNPCAEGHQWYDVTVCHRCGVALWPEEMP